MCRLLLGGFFGGAVRAGVEASANLSRQRVGMFDRQVSCRRLFIAATQKVLDAVNCGGDVRDGHRPVGNISIDSLAGQPDLQRPVRSGFSRSDRSGSHCTRTGLVFSCRAQVALSPCRFRS
ncbi:hypothetical protein ADK66_15110 [Micromonospora sp. NRRL B-16802]|nr:hypothetical protein ADK66_15110 [Micromonospora sp. NRRL B-16802]